MLQSSSTLPHTKATKVRNFDDPNLDSEDYLRVNFQNEEPKMASMEIDTSQFSDFDDLTPLFTVCKWRRGRREEGLQFIYIILTSL